MIKSCQIVNAVQGLPFMGNPKQIVIHDLNRTLANYNESSFNMVKNDVKQFCPKRQLDLQKLLNLSLFRP